MNLETYVQEGETINSQTTARRDYHSDVGELAVTDVRLIHIQRVGISDDRVLDVDISKINELEYHENPIKWKYLLAAVLVAVVGIIVLQFITIAPGVPNDARLPVGIGGMIFVGGLLYEALKRKQRLIVRTSSDSHTFVGNGLRPFPNAIRDNS